MNVHVVMAGGRVIFCSRVFSLVFTFCLLFLSEFKEENYMFSDCNSCLRLEATGAIREPESTSCLLPCASQVRRRRTNRGFLKCRIPYDVSGICSFQLKKLSGDVHPNPGPSRNGIKFPCGECQRSIRSNQDAILCTTCEQWFHARCIGMCKQVFKDYLENDNLDWECAFCSLPKFNDSFFGQTEHGCLNEADLLNDNIRKESSEALLDDTNPAIKGLLID